eukprot:Clim_evm160s147 gene=Clim_evmTU160s147
MDPTANVTQNSTNTQAGGPPGAQTAGDATRIPALATAIERILDNLGVETYEPKVVSMLMEFAYRYIADVLEEAVTLAYHRGEDVAENGGTGITAADVRLAVQQYVNFHFQGVPPRQFLMELARKRNREPLPLYKDHKPGVRLPAELNTLLQPNYVLDVRHRPKPKPEEAGSSTNQDTDGTKALELTDQPPAKKAKLGEEGQAMLTRPPVEGEDDDENFD